MSRFENMGLWQWLKLLRIFWLLIAVVVAIVSYYRRLHPTPAEVAGEQAFLAKEARNRAWSDRIDTIRATQGDAQALRAMIAITDSLIAASGVVSDSAMAGTAAAPTGE